jgi:hypothetical protein
MKYYAKPVVIEAIKWEGHNQRAMFDFLTDGKFKNKPMVTEYDTFVVDHSRVECGLIVKTFEGECPVHVGEYVVKGTAGEFYPCKPDIFEYKYVPVYDISYARARERERKAKSIGTLEYDRL